MRIETPASHRDDPESSLIAESNMNKSGKRFSNQAIITLHVKVFAGKTAAEIGRLCGLGQHEASRRLSELNGITVRKGERRQCSVKNTNMVTWFPILDAN